MAYALLDSVSVGSSNGDSAITASIDTTGASLVVAFASWHPGVSEGTMGDGPSNAYDTSLTMQTAGSSRGKLYFVANPTTSATHQFVYTTTDGFPSLYVLVFSGAHSSPYTSQESGATASAISVEPGSLTPPEDNCLLVSGCAYTEATRTFSIPTPAGWTVAEQLTFSSGQYFGGGIGYQIQTSATASNPAWTLDSGSGSLAAAMAVFKAASGITPGAAALSLAGQALRMDFAINMPDEL
jgi:hypothetical protein